MPHGPVMLDLSGAKLEPDEREMLLHPATGGVILFSRHYESIEQISVLIQEIHALRKPELLVAVDQEGGRVQRFISAFTRLPAAARFGELYDASSEKGIKAAQSLGWLMAAELRRVGVDFSFAPVLDVEQGVSGVIGNRAFHSSPEAVADLAIAWAAGAREAGMPSIGKHFPGHGGVKEDSHLELPVDPRDLEALGRLDLIPFTQAIAAGLEGIMPAHVIYPAVDALPAGFSSKWLKDILRGQMGFQGVIFSDDLSMEAANVAGNPVERAAIALDAGCDMVLICNNQQAASDILDTLIEYGDPTSQARLARMQGRQEHTTQSLRDHPGWQGAIRQIAELTLSDATTMG